MDNIEFRIPICADVRTLFEAATVPNTPRYDIVDIVIDQIHQGDPVWEDVCEEIKELFGEEAGDIFNSMTDNLKEYISYTGVCNIDYEEIPHGFLVYRVSCEFNVDKFAQKYNLESAYEEKDI